MSSNTEQIALHERLYNEANKYRSRANQGNEIREREEL